MPRVYLHDIEFDYDDIAELMRSYRSNAAKIIKEMDAETLIAWQEALSNRRTPGPDEFCGVHWSDAEAKLEHADPEIRRWLLPFVRALAPRPLFVEPLRKKAA